MQPLILEGQPLALSDVHDVARSNRSVRVGETARRNLLAARTTLEEHAHQSGEAIYGVNTGFGSLARVRIDPDQVREVQRNLVRSHAAGVGEPLPDEIVRVMLLILAASLARGYSGVRVEVVERIVDLLNQQITPVVPSRGSVGASGDLAPLAHAALVLIGEGRARYKDQVLEGGAAPSIPFRKGVEGGASG